MDLQVCGQVVIGQGFGCTISFAFTGGFELRIENDCTLRSESGSIEFSPGPANANSPRGVELVGKEVDSAAVEAGGALVVKFANGSELQVPASEDFEARTLAGQAGVEVVSMPSGEIATWGCEA